MDSEGRANGGTSEEKGRSRRLQQENTSPAGPEARLSLVSPPGSRAAPPDAERSQISSASFISGRSPRETPEISLFPDVPSYNEYIDTLVVQSSADKLDEVGGPCRLAGSSKRATRV